MKEAREFRENSSARSKSVPLSTEIRTVAQGLQKWLEVCEKEGRNGRDPVSAGIAIFDVQGNGVASDASQTTGRLANHPAAGLSSGLAWLMKTTRRSGVWGGWEA